MLLELDEPVYVIPGGEACKQLSLVLMNAEGQVFRHADIHPLTTSLSESLDDGRTGWIIRGFLTVLQRRIFFRALLLHTNKPSQNDGRDAR